MSENKYFGPEKNDRFFIELLITKVHRIFVTKELLKDVVEGHLRYVAPEHARMAMFGYGRSSKLGDDSTRQTPMDIFAELQTMAWDEILDRPMAPLNGLRSGLGECFDHVIGSGGEMHKDRQATEWAEILGLPINTPTFLEAVTMWVHEEVNKRAKSEEKTNG